MPPEWLSICGLNPRSIARTKKPRNSSVPTPRITSAVPCNSPTPSMTTALTDPDVVEPPDWNCHLGSPMRVAPMSAALSTRIPTVNARE